MPTKYHCRQPPKGNGLCTLCCKEEWNGYLQTADNKYIYVCGLCAKSRLPFLYASSTWHPGWNDYIEAASDRPTFESGYWKGIALCSSEYLRTRLYD